ncbi:MAG: hypothetical protein EXR94_00450 [Gemmatimonadetes bacterium]|nr:hypothetical protein [Gemmatimonadota bacterium]
MDRPTGKFGIIEQTWRPVVRLTAYYAVLAGNLTFMDPVTGNAMLAYARLNVPDGMWNLYNRPFEAEHFRQPALVETSSDVDVLGARFDSGRQVLRLAGRSRGGKPTQATLQLANVPADRAWVVRRDRRVIMTSRQERRDDRLRVTLPLNPGTTRLELELG